MKKVTFLLATLLIGGLLLMGCKKDPVPTPEPESEVNPTLTLLTGENYLAEGFEVMAYHSFHVGLKYTGQDLETLKITFMKGDEQVYEINKDLHSGGLEYGERISFEEAGNYTMNAILTDAQNKTASLSINFIVKENIAMNFAGSYKGYMITESTANIPGMGVMPVPTDSVMTTIEIVINEGETTAEVTITTLDGESTVLNGTFDGTTLNFEPFTEDTNIPDIMTFTMIYTLHATRVDNFLNLNGSVTGSGEVLDSQTGVFVPISMEGTVSGDLEKVE